MIKKFIKIAWHDRKTGAFRIFAKSMEYFIAYSKVTKKTVFKTCAKTRKREKAGKLETKYLLITRSEMEFEFNLAV